MQQISWEVMKIYPLKIYEIRYWSFFLSVTLHVSYVCFMKQTPGWTQQLPVFSLRFDPRDFELVGRLCLTSHRQRGHLETAPPFTFPCEGHEAQ